MAKFKKSLATIIFLSLFSVAALVSCGKQAQKEEAPASEAAEHPTDSTEHPSDSTNHDHPADSTNNQ